MSSLWFEVFSTRTDLEYIIFYVIFSENVTHDVKVSLSVLRSQGKKNKDMYFG